MTTVRDLSTFMIAAMLVGCFAEPSTSDESIGSTQGTSSSGPGGSTDEPATSSSEAGSVSGTGETSSTGTSTGAGATSGLSSSSGDAGGTTAAETTTGEPPGECAEGFDGLTILSLGIPEIVAFTDVLALTDVSLSLDQGRATMDFTYNDSQPGGPGFTWTFTGTLSRDFVEGGAVLTFRGIEPGGGQFESSCEIELN